MVRIQTAEISPNCDPRRWAPGDCQLSGLSQSGRHGSSGKVSVESVKKAEKTQASVGSLTMAILFVMAIVMVQTPVVKAGPPVRYEFNQAQMGIPFKIVLYAHDEIAANSAASAAFSRIADLNQIFSDYIPNSELSRLNRMSPTSSPVPVSAELWDVLNQAQLLSRDTAGAFDVTVGPYVRLWRRARRQKELPPEKMLREAASRVGYSSVVLDHESKSVGLTRRHMQIDLGGIAVGYALDQAMGVLKEQGIQSALIDGSGDILVSEPPPGKKGWRIGIEPVECVDAPAGRFIRLSNAAIANSGDAFQHVEINSVRYSHIVDPRTGLGLTDRSSVTIIASNGTQADSYSTAVSVLGPEAGIRFVEKQTGTEVFIVDVSGGKLRCYESSGFNGFLCAIMD